MRRCVGPVVASGLCTSCGLCAAACPVGAVSFERAGGSMLPVLDGCLECGRCLRVCPGKGGSLDALEGTLGERMAGPCLHAASAWSAEGPRFSSAVSGGTATQLVASLLESGAYDSAFLVGDAAPGAPLAAARHVAGDDLSPTQRSKYGQASHEGTLRHMREHPGERVIVTATPCAVRGLLNAVDAFRLDRENYLFIGLFCDKTMTASASLYLAARGGGAEVEAVDYRTKDVGGWPGGVRLRLAGGGHVDLPNTERMRVKEYFQPECCLYCLDKLNARADISLGDDYTGGGANPEGANSVVVRTERGMAAWEAALPHLAEAPCALDSIVASQHLGGRAQNLAFAALKERSDGFLLDRPINADVEALLAGGAAVSADANSKAYAERLRKLRMGASYEDDPLAIRREVNGWRAKAQRVVGRIKRLAKRVMRR